MLGEHRSSNFSHMGHCEICEKDVLFVADGPYFRNTLKCTGCGSTPRYRALFHALNKFVPRWRDCDIHESSPGWDPVTLRLRAEAKTYVASQWDLSIPFGSFHSTKGYRSEDLQDQTFASESFDIVITQDVFEHVFNPELAIKEIARTLRPGGAYLMTVPIVRKRDPSRRRASLVDGKVVHHLPPEYHGNPVHASGRMSDVIEGSLVTIDWGYDIVGYLQNASGLHFLLFNVDNIDLGIRAELNDVLVAFKRALPAI